MPSTISMLFIIKCFFILSIRQSRLFPCFSSWTWLTELNLSVSMQTHQPRSPSFILRTQVVSFLHSKCRCVHSLTEKTETMCNCEQINCNNYNKLINCNDSMCSAWAVLLDKSVVLNWWCLRPKSFLVMKLQHTKIKKKKWLCNFYYVW